MSLLAPAVSDGPQAHANWVELLALQAGDSNSSLQDLATVLRRTGSADAIVEEEIPSNRVEQELAAAESVAESAFAEVANREEACGPTYPFEVGDGFIQAKDSAPSTIYTFLLLLSWFGKDAGPKTHGPEKLFEEVCLYAGSKYFGGEPLVKSYLFGFPRRRTARQFKPALNELCEGLGEGRGARQSPRTKDQKDAHLDVVIWKDFDDRRQAKLIGFGQCATGRHWRDKISDLRPREWCDLWMLEQPRVKPIPMFFVPHRVSLELWPEVSVYGGLIFDRCRVSACCQGIDETLGTRCQDWSRDVIAERLTS